MKLYAGTSGYSYAEWKGVFYPQKLPAKEMLRYYAGRLPAVEINNTFYRLPKPGMLETWAEQVPAGFRFSLKASRRITHIKRLKEAGDETEYLFRTSKVLGERLGVVLFQLPPYLKKDKTRLEAFLPLIPEGTRAAFEFRHESWFDDEIHTLLRNHGCALCVTDADGDETIGIVSTSDWGYLRLRREDYSQAELERWARRIRSQSWGDAFVFFKHEDDAAGPKMASRFLALAATAADPQGPKERAEPGETPDSGTRRPNVSAPPSPSSGESAERHPPRGGSGSSPKSS